MNSVSWTARARVRVVNLKDARIELRLITKSATRDIRMRTVSTISSSEDDFQFLSVFETEPPSDTSEILVQLAMISLSDSGHGTVIWDGIELRPGRVFSTVYLDGDQPGAAWSGKPHMSSSYWEVDQPTLDIILGSERSGTGRVADTISIPGPFDEGEAVQIMPGSVVVTGKSSTRIYFHDLKDLKNGDNLELLYSAPSIPRLVRSVDAAGS